MRIETSRLLLRPMEESDVEPLLGVFGDPAVMAAFETAPFDRTQMERWIRRNLAHQTAHGYGLCTVVLRAGGLVIGDCGLEHTVVDGIPEVELGYDIRRDHWNQGLATEAATAVRDHAMDSLGLPVGQPHPRRERRVMPGRGEDRDAAGGGDHPV